MTTFWDVTKSSSGATISNNNLTVISSANTHNTIANNYRQRSGKWYWEVTIDSSSNKSYSSIMIGIVNENVIASNNILTDVNARWFYSYDGTLYGGSTNGAPYSNLKAHVNNVVGVMLDLDNGTLSFSINGVSYGIAYSDIGSANMWFPAVINGSSFVMQSTVSFAKNTMKYPIPSDYIAFDDMKINKTLILHEQKYKKFNAEVFASDTVYSKGIVPTLTSNSSNGLAFSSTPMDSAWGAYRAFSVDYNYWSAYAHSGNGYIGYLALSPMKLDSYSLAPSGNINQMISKWRLYGSNNTTTGVDGDWEEIDYREYTNWASGQSVMFDLSKEVTYLAVKLTWESNVGNVANGINIGRFDFHKVEKEAVKASPSNWSIVSSTLPTSTQFLSDGMDSLTPLLNRRVETLEPLLMTDKSEILQVGEEGKVFSRTIDLKKYLDLRSIKVEVK